MNAEQRRIKIMSELMRKGYTEEEAIAIVANVDIETGGTYDPSTKQRGVGNPEDWWKETNSGRGTGIIQWDDRRNNLKKFAEEKGKSWDDLQTQIDFLDHELKTSEKYGWNKVQKIEDVVDKTKAFTKYIERPGKPHYDKREKAAQKLIDANIKAKGSYYAGLPKEEKKEEEGSVAPQNSILEKVKKQLTQEGEVDLEKVLQDERQRRNPFEMRLINKMNVRGFND